MTVCPVLESIRVVTGTQRQDTVFAFSRLVTTQCSMTSAVGGGIWLRTRRRWRRLGRRDRLLLGGAANQEHQQDEPEVSHESITVRLAHYNAHAHPVDIHSRVPRPSSAWAGIFVGTRQRTVLSPGRAQISPTVKLRRAHKEPQVELGRVTLECWWQGRTYISAYRKPSVLPT